jgi:hypothetical protein
LRLKFFLGKSPEALNHNADAQSRNQDGEYQLEQITRHILSR